LGKFVLDSKNKNDFHSKNRFDYLKSKVLRELENFEQEEIEDIESLLSSEILT
jgi:hypothetical protein